MPTFAPPPHWSSLKFLTSSKSAPKIFYSSSQIVLFLQEMSLNLLLRSVDPWVVEAVTTKAEVLKKLSLAGLAKLSRPRYSLLRFGLASAGYRGRCTQPANSQLIPQSTLYNHHPEDILLGNWKSKNVSQYLWIQKVYCERFVYIFQFFRQRLTFEKELEHLWSAMRLADGGRCKESKKTQWQSKILCILKAPSYGILLPLVLLRLSYLSQLFFFFWFLVTNS
jgi:hypothetical protein